MFITNPRFDTFKFQFPLDFFKSSVVGKYNEWMEINPRSLQDIQSLVNASIQSITLPSYGQEPIVQQQPRNGGSVEVATNTVQPFEKLVEDNTFSVTVKHCSGFSSYFLMLEHFYQYTEQKNGTISDFKKVPDMSVNIIDLNGNVLFTFVFNGIIYTGIDGLELSKARQTSEFTTFDVRFRFNSYKLLFHTPERKKVHD